LNNFFHKI